MKARSYVELTGRLIGTPKTTVVGVNKTVKEFGIIVDHGSDTSFFDVMVWGEEAEAFQGQPGLSAVLKTRT